MSRLKVGDRVVLNKKYIEYENNKNKVFKIIGFEKICGTYCAYLDGFGAYAYDGLERYGETWRMSEILIKNMALPKQGWKRLILLPDGEVREICGDEAVRSTDARAVELPPHGDLIDRSKLVLHGRVDDFGDLQEMNDYYDATEVMNAPTILEASK